MMTEGTSLYALRINHGQSEIWLARDGKELTQRRTIATNEVLNVTRRHCAPEVFAASYAEYNTAVGYVVALSIANLNEIAAELNLRASSPTAAATF
jgi:hypothetical protein